VAPSEKGYLNSNAWDRRECLTAGPERLKRGCRRRNRPLYHRTERRNGSIRERIAPAATTSTASTAGGPEPPPEPRSYPPPPLPPGPAPAAPPPPRTGPASACRCRRFGRVALEPPDLSLPTCECAGCPQCRPAEPFFRYSAGDFAQPAEENDPVPLRALLLLAALLVAPALAGGNAQIGDGGALMAWRGSRIRPRLPTRMTLIDSARLDSPQCE